MRPVDVARGTGITTQRAANTLRLLCEAGEVRRIRNPGIMNGPGASMYVWVLQHSG
jgi:hypothetical protein